MNKQIKSLSIIFPVYKDTKTIETMINKCQNLILRHNLDSEIIVVNDCCPDGSGEIADEVAKKFNNVIVLHHEHNASATPSIMVLDTIKQAHTIIPALSTVDVI